MSEPFEYQAFNIDDWIITPEDQSFLDFNTSFDSIPPPVEGGMDLGGVPAAAPAAAAIRNNTYTNTCATCGQIYERDVNYRIHHHGMDEGHPGFSCSVLGCDKLFIDFRERDAHQERPHVSGHGRCPTVTPYDCIQCGESSSSKANLLRHAKEQQHQPYACDCGTSFSRLDVLNRHLEKFSTEEPKYPCSYCRLHRGPDGFRRHDHLLQHMRNYHHHDIESENTLKHSFPVCSYTQCPEYRDESFQKLPKKEQDRNRPFTSRSAYTKHMREAHNECPFPCDVVGCCRVGRKGYFREKDLLKHRKDEHPECDPYQVVPRDTRTTCLDCGLSLDPSSLSWHSRYCHPERKEACHNVSFEGGEELNVPSILTLS